MDKEIFNLLYMIVGEEKLALAYTVIFLNVIDEHTTGPCNNDSERTTICGCTHGNDRAEQE